MTIKAMVDGVWHAAIEDSPDFRARRMKEKKRWFRDQIAANGESNFPAEAGRYHLYVSHACPWAHRAVLYRTLKGLEDIVSMSVVDPRWGGPNGWIFGETDDPATDVTIDHANGLSFLYEVYRLAKPDFTGKITVPVLFDRKTGVIVNNESVEIMRMFDDAFDGLASAERHFRPLRLRPAIDALSDFVIDRICMGVYRAGFADTQDGYDRAVHSLFEALDEMEARLSKRRYLFGDAVTETDWHLFTTLVRFDAVYYGALRCNQRRLVDYPNLWAYTRRLYALPGVAETVRLDHVKRHYYDDLGLINPAIVPAGPLIDFGDVTAIAA